MNCGGDSVWGGGVTPLPEKPRAGNPLPLLLHAISAGLLNQPEIRQLLQEARDHFGIADPVTRRDAAWNRRHAPRDELRSYLAERLTDLAASCKDDDARALLQLAFDTESLLTSAAPPPDEPIDPLSKDFDRLFTEAVNRSGIPEAYRRYFTNLLADTVTDGQLSPPRPFATSSGHFLFDLPTGDDTVVCLVATRASDLEKATKEFRARWRHHFRPGKRDRQPRDPERDFWVVWQYFEIRDDDTFTDQTLYDELLNRFQESPYSADLDRYDLDTRDGQIRAKGWLRQIVYRRSAAFRNLIEQADANAAPKS
jgi:hypothetical protein